MIHSANHHWCLQTLPPKLCVIWILFDLMWDPQAQPKKKILPSSIFCENKLRQNSISIHLEGKDIFSSCSCFSVHIYESQGAFWPHTGYSSVFISHYHWSLHCTSAGWQESLQNQVSWEKDPFHFSSLSLYFRKKKAPFSVVNFPRECDCIYNGHCQK